MSDSDSSDTVQPTDATGDPIAADEVKGEGERVDPNPNLGPDPEPVGPRVGPSGREVVVPLSLYKTVTALSTFVAIATYLVGFILIDAATLQVSFVRRILAYLIGSVGLTLSDDVLTALFAIVGVGSILLGTAAYVLGTRFRAQGMGKPQEDATEE